MVAEGLGAHAGTHLEKNPPPASRMVIGKDVEPLVGQRIQRLGHDSEKDPTLGTIIRVIQRICTCGGNDSSTLSVLVKWDGSEDAGTLCRTGLGGKFDIELSGRDLRHPLHSYSDDDWIISRVASAASSSPPASAASSTSGRMMSSPGSESPAEEEWDASREGSPAGGASAGVAPWKQPATFLGKPNGGQPSKFDEFSIARAKKYDSKIGEAERKKLLTSISSSFRQGGSNLMGRARKLTQE